MDFNTKELKINGRLKSRYPTPCPTDCKDLDPFHHESEGGIGMHDPDLSHHDTA